MSKAATMEIPINSNGDTGTLPEDDSLEQVGHIYSISWQCTECGHPVWLLFTYFKILHKQINMYTVGAYWLLVLGQLMIICILGTVYRDKELFLFLFISFSIIIY